MSLESEVYSYLSSQTAITNIVGTRIYPLVMPESGTYPALVYSLVPSSYQHRLSGSNGIAEARFQFDALTTSLSESDALIEAVRQALQGYQGTLDQDECISSVLNTVQDLTQTPVDGSDNRIYRKMADFTLRIRVSIPTP